MTLAGCQTKLVGRTCGFVRRLLTKSLNKANCQYNLLGTLGRFQFNFKPHALSNFY